ncbi:hypothetical protein ACWKWU_08705 [Chitinophaga lutea]
MKRMLLPVASLIVLSTLSCKKETSLETPPASNVCDYAPYTVGSEFSYEMVDNASSDTLRFGLRALKDSIIDKKPHRVLEDDLTGELSFFRCGGGSYYQVAPITGIPNVPDTVIASLYLKDNAALGSSWEEEVLIDLPPIGQIPLTLSYTIIQKGTSKTVLGKRFDNVIGVRMDISLPPLLPAEEISTNYFAKGVGLIEVDTPADTTRIASYTIK